jgi:hypothetical protein
VTVTVTVAVAVSIVIVAVVITQQSSLETVKGGGSGTPAHMTVVGLVGIIVIAISIPVVHAAPVPVVFLQEL